eukprot:CAMPEP_0197030240 /NCGR_PEP_ID=MMETSP1384-20130603/9512_1 /TAXON_ID=29189 /ORGANISM="Ammonia sp." /LENGTH=568 /DNA_ID=CAMNT_0042459547 /DNA_START=48 /DNA_END=1754 /DNA_ORIENTATION=-
MSWFAIRSSLSLSKNNSTRGRARGQSHPLPDADDEKAPIVLETSQFRRRKRTRASHAVHVPQRPQKAQQTVNCREHPLVMALSIDLELNRKREQEQKTRKLTAERERKKQEQLTKLKQEHRIFDIALLINAQGEYDKILCGPVTYQVFYKHIRFLNCQNYIHNDIKLLQMCTTFVEELSAKDIDEYFCNLSEFDSQIGINFEFCNIARCQMFRFDDDEHRKVWTDHKTSQQNLNFDIFVVVDRTNQPIYVFMDVNMNVIDERIKFARCHEYQCCDVQMLTTLAAKCSEFRLSSTYSYFRKERMSEFPHNFSNDVLVSFQHGICYKFHDTQCRQQFYHQRYDVAVLMDADSEPAYLLHDVEYGLIDGTVAYQTCERYHNGYSHLLEECAQQIKCVKSYGCVQQSAKSNAKKRNVRQCNVTMFKLQNAELWHAYKSALNAVQYDIAVLTDMDGNRAVTLFDVTVNWNERSIDFELIDAFCSKHSKILQHYGELITNDAFSGFVISKWDECGVDENLKVNRISFYQLNAHSNDNYHEHNQIPCQQPLVFMSPRDSIFDHSKQCILPQDSAN